jgi:hypothetical protein
MQARLIEHRQRSSGLILEASKVGSRTRQRSCSSVLTPSTWREPPERGIAPHTRPISLVGVASQNENLKISSLVGRAIVTSPAIPLTAKRSTVLAGVPRSSDGKI